MMRNVGIDPDRDENAKSNYLEDQCGTTLVVLESRNGQIGFTKELFIPCKRDLTLPN